MPSNQIKGPSKIPNPLWRFIPPIEAPGAKQMAIDQWLLEQHRQGEHPPTLRFYTWSPVAISLGYHQRRYPAHWQKLTWQGKPVQLVRRPSGGRAVLHQGDLTYTVVTSHIPGKRIEVYEYICQFLIQGWRSLGIDLHFGNAGRGYIHNPSCFSTATGADLVTAEGYKLIGSAQLCRDKAILQHGSIVLSRDQELFKAVFGETAPTMKLYLEQQTIIDALIQAACDHFTMKLVTQPLSDQEWQKIRIGN